MNPDELLEKLKLLSAEQREAAVSHMSEDEKTALCMLLLELFEEFEDFKLEMLEDDRCD